MSDSKSSRISRFAAVRHNVPPASQQPTSAPLATSTQQPEPEDFAYAKREDSAAAAQTYKLQEQINRQRAASPPQQVKIDSNDPVRKTALLQLQIDQARKGHEK